MKNTDYISIQGWMTKLGLKPAELICYAVIHGYSRDGVHWFSGSKEYLSEWAQINTRSVVNALNGLKEKGLLISKAEPGKPTLYRVKIPVFTEKCNIEQTQEDPCKNCTPESDPCKNCTPPMQKLHTTRAKFAPNIYRDIYIDKYSYLGTESPEQPEPPTNEESTKAEKSAKEKEKRKFAKEVIEYLNHKSGKRFSTKSKQTIAAINARREEGFDIADFKRAIDWCYETWGNDSKMREYIQPSTIFRPRNFEKYVNKTVGVKKKPELACFY
ncbi:conserved phage C-terminal domain-containing protein [Faecalibaculum rodentium]|uniref:conserved phage C-terminal domain-containing protein n=1 Tax=Faecalibaculum rodentium TaxID=1702221 RepID=UPI0023F30835|nr:conserved phage C-terminal domain-containing protein [Faecalibaculum rodentium]